MSRMYTVGRSFIEAPGELRKLIVPFEQCAVLSICNPGSSQSLVADNECVFARLFMEFDDISRPVNGLQMPTREHAKAAIEFAARHADKPIVVQCDGGAGRSQAVIGAMSATYDTHLQILRNGTYNKLLYRLILEKRGLKVPEEKLVSMVVRVKYEWEKMQAFLLCMDAQRYSNWEVIVTTDGPASYDIRALVESATPAVRLVETSERLGQWGHPWRQNGLDVALRSFGGDYICMSNDDNYYVPSYLELMALELDRGADLVLCDQLHAYRGWQWQRTEPRCGSCDLGCFMAKRELVAQVKWPGNDFAADGRFVEELAAKAGKVAHVDRPLFIKN